MAELRRSPVEVGSLSHDLQGFIHPTGGWPLEFLNHQQYDKVQATHYWNEFRIVRIPVTDGPLALLYLQGMLYCKKKHAEKTHKISLITVINDQKQHNITMSKLLGQQSRRLLRPLCQLLTAFSNM